MDKRRGRPSFPLAKPRYRRAAYDSSTINPTTNAPALDGSNGLTIPGQEFVDAIDLVVFDAAKDFSQPGLGIDTVQFSGLNQSIGDGGRLVRRQVL